MQDKILNQKIALVTGAGRGIGRAIALAGGAVAPEMVFPCGASCYLVDERLCPCPGGGRRPVRRTFFVPFVDKCLAVALAAGGAH